MTESGLARANRCLLFGSLVVLILYYGRPVLAPLAFSVFFATLFTPLCNFLELHGVRRTASSLIALLVMIAVTAGIGLLVYMQAKQLANELPQIEKKSQLLVQQAQDYVSGRLNVPEQQQEKVINGQLKSLLESSGKVLKGFVTGLVGICGTAVIVLVLTFLFLLRREKYESFFVQISSHMPPKEAQEVIGQVSRVAQSYLTGRAISVLIFTVLFTLGFLLIGLKGAFLLAFVAALLTIVPYIGSIVGGLFPFAVALLTEDSTATAFGALAVIVIIQGIDNYFIEPYIIGGEVHINAPFTILILFVGGLLWGVAGMVLFLPMLGVAKIIFDHVPALRPYGFLVGDQKKKKPSGKLLEAAKRLFGMKK